MGYGTYKGKDVEQKLSEFYETVLNAPKNHEGYGARIETIRDGDVSKFLIHSDPIFRTKFIGIRDRLDFFNDVVVLEYMDSGLREDSRNRSLGLRTKVTNNHFKSGLEMHHKDFGTLRLWVPLGSTALSRFLGSQIRGEFIPSGESGGSLENVAYGIVKKFDHLPDSDAQQPQQNSNLSAPGNIYFYTIGGGQTTS